jgi:hypothetical protein
MFRKFGFAALLAAILALISALPFRVRVNAARPPRQGRDVITQEIDEAKLIVLRGNTRPEANRGNDRGYVGDDFPLEHMFLQLKRSPEQEQALEEYLDELTDRNSANSHQWLTAIDLGQTYGVSDADIEKITKCKDYIFLSVLSFGAPPGCSSSLSNGCVMGFDVTSASISPATAPPGATAEAGGTSGIIVDNTSTFGGASNIYYTPLANQRCPSSGGCAIQISQAAP